MTHASLRVAGTLLVSAVTVPPVAAQVAEERTTLGVELGRVAIDAGSFESDATRFNVRVGHAFGRPLEAELSLFGADAEEELLPGVTRSVKHLVLAGNVLYGFRPHEFVSPYVLFGVSIGTLEFEAIGLSDREFSLGIQGAAGCRFRIGETRRSAIRLEVSLGYMQGIDWSTEAHEGDVRFASLGVGYERVLGGSGKEATGP